MLNFNWWVNRKDPQGTQRLRRRLPGARQHRRLRPQRAAAHRRDARAGGRHGLDGLLLPEHAGDGPHPRRARPGLRGDRLQVPRELHLDRLRHGQGRRPARTTCGTRQDGFYYDVLRLPDGDGVPARRSARWSGSCRSARARCSRQSLATRHPKLHGADRAVPEAPPRGDRPRGADPRRVHRPRRAPAALAAHPDEARAHPRATCSTRTSSSARTASARSRATTSSTRSSSAPAARSIASSTCPPSPNTGCSAATRTGAGRSGCRSTC